MWDDIALFFRGLASGSAKGGGQGNMPPLRFHNTLSGVTELFSPLSPREVKMYNCGPTVYDRQHIGNLRGPILANLVRLTLEAWGYRVRHVSNITDVGHLTGDNSGDADQGVDRMELGAQRRGMSAQEIAAEYTELFFEDLDAVGIDRSKIIFTPATRYIPEQLALIKTLEEKGYTYRIKDGIYFDTSKFPGYGKLGKIPLAGLLEGARVEENPEKKNPHDFALWKFSKPGEKRQQEWDSPWGVGFPGWHLECTAMIFKELGKQIDIHIGGIDLIPIHHNNELAQAEAATGRQFVRYWMHNEFITIEGKKVSKSLGNTVYLHNLTDRGLSPRALRYWYLTGQYRSPMNFTWEGVAGANTALQRLSRFFFEELADAGHGEADPAFLRDFFAAMADDLDTPRALARLWELVHDDAVSPAAKKASLLKADAMLGLGLSRTRPEARLSVLPEELPEDIRALLTERENARAAKDFAKADELRDTIQSLGYQVTDTPGGMEVSKNTHGKE